MVRGAFGRVVSLLGACRRALADGVFRGLLRSARALHASRLWGSARAVGPLFSLRSLRARWLVAVAVSWVALVVGVVGLVQVSSFFSDLRSLVAFQDTLLKTSVPLDVRNLRLDTHIGVLEDEDPTESATDAASVANVGFERLVLSDVATLSFDVAYAGEPGEGVANMKGSMVKLAWGDPDDALPVRGYFYLYPSNWTAASIRNDVNNGAASSLNKADDVLNLPMNDGDVYAQGQTYVFQSADAFLVHPADVDLVDADPDNDRSSQTFTFKVAFVRDYAAGSDANTQLQTDFMQFDGKRLHVDVFANSRLGMTRKELELKAKITPTMIAGTTENANQRFWGTTQANTYLNKQDVETVDFVDAADTTTTDSAGNTFTAAGGSIDALTEAITVPASWNGMPVLSSWDVSVAKDQTAMAFYTDSKAGTANKYDLYVAGRQGVLAGNASNLFFNFTAMTDIDVTNLDICESTTSYQMLRATTALAGIVGEENFRTRNTTDLRAMFYSSRVNEPLVLDYGGFADQSKPNVGAWDTGNVNNTSTMFQDMARLEEVHVNGWNFSDTYTDGTARGVSLDTMFRDTVKLREIDGITDWVTTGVNNVLLMFFNAGDNAQTTLKLDLHTNGDKWNVSKVTTLGSVLDSDPPYSSKDNGMFTYSDFAEIDVTGWDTSNVTSMRSTFKDTPRLASVTGIGTWKTGSLGYAEGMFWRSGTGVTFDPAVVNLDLSAKPGGVWDTSNLRAAWWMFRQDSTLRHVDMTGWDLSDSNGRTANSIYGMFYDATRLCAIDGISSWSTSGVNNMNAMFRNWANDAVCAGVTLDLHTSGAVWNTARVTNAADMFYGSSKVESIGVAGWEFPTLSGSNGGVTLANMFRGTAMLGALPGIETWDTSGVWSTANMFDSWATGVTFTGTEPCDLCLATTGAVWGMSKVTNASYMFSTASKVRTIDTTGWQFVAPTNNVNLQGLFYNTYLLETPFGVEDWPTSSVTNISYMFYQSGNSQAKVFTIDLDPKGSGVWDVSLVTTAAYMFYNADRYGEVSANGWDTGKVTTMRNMFDNAGELTTLDATGWDFGDDTGRTAISLEAVFQSTTKLHEVVGITDWPTSGVNNLYHTFFNAGDAAQTVLEIDLHTDGAKWNTARVTNLGDNIAGYGTSDQGTFCNSKFTKINVTGWDVSKVTTMDTTFKGTYRLDAPTGIGSWKTDSVVRTRGMFMGMGTSVTYDPDVVNVDVSTKADGSWNVSKLTNAFHMFNNMTTVHNVDVTDWDLSDVNSRTGINLQGMFINTTKLRSAKGITSWKTSGVGYLHDFFRNSGDVSMTTLELDLHANGSGAWDMANLVTMGEQINGYGTTTTGMFDSSRFTKIDMTGWDTPKLQTMDATFSGASRLTNIAGLDTWNVPDLRRARMTFSGTPIATLDLSGFDMTAVTSFDRFLNGTGNLAEIEIGSNFVIGVSTDVSNMTNGLAASVPKYTGKWFRDLHPTDLDTPVNIFKQNTTVAQGTWYAEHTVSLTLDGNWTGKPADPVKTIRYGDASVPTFAKPTRTGYVFEGYWTGKGAGDGEVTGDQVVSDTGAYVTAAGYVASGVGWTRYADTALYAKWTEAVYDVTVAITRNQTNPITIRFWWDAADLTTDNSYAAATIKGDSTSLVNTDSITLQVPYTQTKGRVAAIFSTSSFSYNLVPTTHTTTENPNVAVSLKNWAAQFSSNQTATAKIAQLYTITYARGYYQSAATGALPAAQTKIHGMAITLPNNNSTCTGWTANGWNLASDGTGTAYASYASYNGNVTSTIYQAWTANTYTVTFDLNGGTGASNTTATATYMSAMPDTNTSGTTLAVPTRTGYDFGGYYDGAGGTGTQYYTSTMGSARTWNKTAPTTLYAKWTIPFVESTVSGYIDAPGNAGYEAGDEGDTFAFPGDTARWRVLKRDGDRRLVIKEEALRASDVTNFIPESYGSAESTHANGSILVHFKEQYSEYDTYGQIYYFYTNSVTGYGDGSCRLSKLIEDYYNVNIQGHEAEKFVMATDLHLPSFDTFKSGIAFSYGNAIEDFEWNSYYTETRFAATAGSGTKQAFALSIGDIRTTLGLPSDLNPLLQSFSDMTGYWLRSPAHHSKATTVSPLPSNVSERHVRDETAAVRPAMWVEIPQ
ncbi:MAG: BspA family leucine-rich repeat surface protein [Bifidobacterium sp.]|uniref:BspA family leucine-rich repeat surface protein n=1 Tax=Bifidobacterium sp. TaxID=41200 RepID=UPI0039E7495C